MDELLIDRLQNDLDAANYRVATVTSLLGEHADGARHRGVFAPAVRALAERDASALSELIRVFLLGQAVPEEMLDTAFPTLTAVGAEQLGLVSRERATSEGAHAALRAALSLNPVAMNDSRATDPVEWWIISDLDDQLRRGPANPDHVMGVGGATRSLVAQAPSHDVQRALDLGTGCGIVALHLALRGAVVATDISARALVLARANARLNGMADRIEFRQGDLFAPVRTERFDLVLSNPPFVITPRGADEIVYEYRDGGLAGDELAARVVREGPLRLTEGGTLLCLANWESPWGENGLERVREWILGGADQIGSLDAWVIERDRVAPAQYAETWARDGGARPGSEEFEALLGSWLNDFAARRIVSIGLGSIRLRRRSGLHEESVVHTDQAVGAFVAEGLGDRLATTFDAGVAAQRMSESDVLDTRWWIDAAVCEMREHQPGEESPRAIVLETDSPVARRVSADTLLAAAVGACDGDLTLRQIADALATLLEVDAAAASDALVAGVRELAWLGMIVPDGR